MGRAAPETSVRDGHTLVQLNSRGGSSVEAQADGEPDAAGGCLHQSLHDQAALHSELEVTRKRADEVVLAPLRRSLEGNLARIARSHQGDLSDDLIPHRWRNVARLLGRVRGLVHER